jgi:hypothetical protein
MLLYVPSLYSSSQGYNEKSTVWMTAYSDTTRILSEIRMQTNFRTVSMCCESVLKMFQAAMVEADKLASRRNPDETQSKNVLLKLQQVKIELERVMIEFSKADDEADQDALERKHSDTMESVADTDIEEAKSNYEAAKEELRRALKILTEHAERQTQVIQKIIS